VLLSDASAYIEKPLRQAAAQYGIDLVIEHVAASTDAVRSLTRLRGAQALLAVPDATLYGPDALRAILESTYRRGMPVIGFSAATVAAGTLATAYPSIDDVAADLFDLLDSLPGSGNGGLPEPRHPRYWRVSVNDSVARSLGVAVSEKVLNLGNSSAGKPG
jgi:putative ABC transport system substrate-binding protein